MTIKHVYKNRLDAKGDPVVRFINVKSSIGKKPELAGLTLYRWAMYIKMQADILFRQNAGRDKRDIESKFALIDKTFSKN